MAQKVTINLNYSGGQLWWSADGRVNWGVVGPSSPVSVLKPGADVDWIADDSIDEITIQLASTKVMNSVSGSKKDKKGQVKTDCKTGDKCKYTITFLPAGAKQPISVDPDLAVCDNNQCPPGDDPD